MKTARHTLAALLLLAAFAAPALAETPSLLRPKEGEKFNDNVFIAVARTNATQCADGEWQIEWQVRRAGAKADDWQPVEIRAARHLLLCQERRAPSTCRPTCSTPRRPIIASAYA